MSLFTDVMTVYNHVNADTEEWKRTVIKGVQWSHGKRQITVSGGVQTEAFVESITVDFDHDYGNPTYINPVEYDALTDKSGYWTLNSKNGLDYVVYGECTITISSLEDIKVQFKGTVTSVSDNRNRAHLKTLKVVAS